MGKALVAYTMRSTNIALIYIGFGSILSQILLIREFLVSFYGNELSIGIIFAGWLVWIGLGSAFGNRIIKRNQNVSHLFSILLAILPLITFAQILAVKFVRVFLHTMTGEFLSMTELLGFSFVTLSIGCLLWGMLFTLGAQSLRSEKKELWLSVNKAYMLELFGSVVGGLLFSFVLTSLLSAFQIVFLNVLIGWSAALWLVLNHKKWFLILTLTGLIIVYAALLQPIRILEHQINAYQWLFINDKLSFIHSIDTKYQNLSLLRLENQYTVYADGHPVYNIPNTYDAEVFTHSIMVHRTDAKRALILGGGFNGVLKEILKYPIEELEYVEIDPVLLPFVKPVLSKQDQRALSDARVKIISGDGREYLHQTNQNYDAILLNVGEPSTASLNRFFTLEFYRQCSSRLTPNGILAFSFPSSTEYLVDELKDLNASIYHTFKQVFNNVLIIPGTHAIIIGSNDKHPFISHPDSLACRYAATKITAELFSKYMFEDLMQPERTKFINKTLESVQDYRLNTDSHPVTYYFDLLLWNRFLQGNNQFFSSITHERVFIVGGISMGLLVLLLLLQRRQQVKRERIALAIIIICGGMIGMALNLLFLLNFQETFGSVYEMVGAMTAANMLGMALGALANAWLTRKYRLKTLLLFTLITLFSTMFLLPKLLDILLLVHLIPTTLIVTMISGGLIGMLFGTVNRFYLLHSQNIGSVYAFDVLGSSIGALTTCSILLPVLGIQETSIFLSLILLPAVLAAFDLIQ